MRVGTGFDAHKFGNTSNGSIRLGGVDIPHNREILAHSDGDAVLHALMDAILGALALGDIGKYFPDTDPAYRQIDSRALLRATRNKMLAAAYRLINADITLIAQVPRVAEYIDVMRQAIAEDMDTDIKNISVKATTTENIGFIGRKEGLAAQATVLLGAAD